MVTQKFTGDTPLHFLLNLYWFLPVSYLPKEYSLSVPYTFLSVLKIMNFNLGPWLDFLKVYVKPNTVFRGQNDYRHLVPKSKVSVVEVLESFCTVRPEGTPKPNETLRLPIHNTKPPKVLCRGGKNFFKGNSQLRRNIKSLPDPTKQLLRKIMFVVYIEDSKESSNRHPWQQNWSVSLKGGFTFVQIFFRSSSELSDIVSYTETNSTPNWEGLSLVYEYGSPTSSPRKSLDRI